jgi:ABC-2 type transport system ATP-binding protein
MLSTHILPEVEAVCDRAIVIAGGRIVAQGTPDELRKSRQMAARVLVECRGPRAEVENTLARVSGVADVQMRESLHAGASGSGSASGGTNGQYVVAALRPREGYDIREEVARTVIQHGWPLREIRLESATLEEFFVEVTASQAMAKSEAK